MQTQVQGICLGSVDGTAGDFLNDAGEKVSYEAKRKLKFSFPNPDGGSTEAEFKVPLTPKTDVDRAILSVSDQLDLGTPVVCLIGFQATDKGLFRAKLFDVRPAKKA